MLVWIRRMTMAAICANGKVSRPGRSNTTMMKQSVSAARGGLSVRVSSASKSRLPSPLRSGLRPRRQFAFTLTLDQLSEDIEHDEFETVCEGEGGQCDDEGALTRTQ